MMSKNRLGDIENELHDAYMKLLLCEIPVEKWLDSKEYEEVAIKISDLHGFFTLYPPKDGRLLLHHKVMQVIWSPTIAIMENIVFEDVKDKRKRLLETWKTIQGYVDVIIEDAQIGEEMDD